MSVSRFAPPLRELLQLAWPVMISQIAVMAAAAIDTAMAGHLSPIDLAAVGIGAAIYSTIVITLSSVLLALPPTVAHLAGAQRHHLVGEEVRQSAYVALGLAAVTVFFLRHPDWLLRLADLQPAVEARVREYLNAASWGIPGMLLFRVFSGLSTGIGRPRPVMIFNLAMLASKAPLNLLFMYGYLGLPAMGGAGCAAATATISWILMPLSWLLCARDSSYRNYGIFERFSAPHRGRIVDLLKLGLPIGATFLVDVTAFTFMALFIARLGPIASGAHQIAANLAALTFMLPLALGNAAAVLVGRALGAGNPHMARELGLVSIGTAMCFGVCVSLILAVGSPLIAALYTNSEHVQSLAQPLILLVALYHLADAMQGSSVNILRGYRRTTAPMVIYAVTLWGLGLGGGYVLGLTDWLGAPRGAVGFWIAAVISLGLVGLAVVAYFLYVSRRALASPPIRR